MEEDKGLPKASNLVPGRPEISFQAEAWLIQRRASSPRWRLGVRTHIGEGTVAQTWYPPDIPQDVSVHFPDSLAVRSGMPD